MWCNKKVFVCLNEASGRKAGLTEAHPDTKHYSETRDSIMAGRRNIGREKFMKYGAPLVVRKGIGCGHKAGSQRVDTISSRSTGPLCVGVAWSSRADEVSYRPQR